jgi:alanyl-tRNA synthetase
MNSQEIRSAFVRFFEQKQHQFVPSAPIVSKDDPSLMFTNAGMNQFKDYFLGNKPATYPRVVNSQKCLRVSGKHNDLEEVGLDTYHHTMFEMLGNWSFGDYFKREAIAWAWELLTEVYHLPPERLYATVFGGDEGDGLAIDQEAVDYWKEWMAEDRILLGSKKDNFWEMGDTGPCGPCSEIHIDLREPAEIEAVPGRELVNQDHPRVVEIWNLVFMQFNRQQSGELQPLADRHIDTGMGFERLVMAIQNKASNYDTDVFAPLIARVSQRAGVTYGSKPESDVAIRVIVDHIRAIAFTIGDGQLPANNKAGYVIRRILRRAVRYGYTFLNFKSPFLHELVPILAEQFASIFPTLREQQAFIAKVVREEEQSFLRTLEVGLRKMEQINQEHRASGTVPGAVAFELYDTFGFPFDLTALLARENGLAVDEAGFEAAMAQQKERSRTAAVSDAGDWTVVNNAPVTFVGYDYLTAEAQIVKYRAVREKDRTYYQVVLDTTPFYPEGGGQVGDTGYLEGNGERIRVVDTKKDNDLVVHITEQLPGDTEATFRCVVDADKRQRTQNNHTATHLLHAALREILGDHVQQRGSLVNDRLLRFDFSHFAKLTDEEMKQVEQRVNQKIRQNLVLDERRNVPIDEAKAMGAMALFGEKYGDRVRVNIFDPAYSVELCGGTHVAASGNIGLFKITSEGSTSAGIRRIEAVTAEVAEAQVDQQEQLVRDIQELLKQPRDLKKAVETLLNDKNHLQKQLSALQLKETAGLKDALLNEAYPVEEAEVIIAQVDLPNADALKKLAFDLKNQQENLVLVLAADVAGKPQIAVAIGEGLIQKYDLHAGKLVKELAKHIQGGGGGQPFFATAGGKHLAGLPQVVKAAKSLLEQVLGS